MSEVKISAEPRTEFGKGGARRTRRAGKVPAVLYGHGEKPQHISLPSREFAAAIRKGGANQLFAIDITDGTQVLALPKAIQRDPIRDTFEHVDLILVRRGEQVTVDVPVQLTGEAARDTLIVHDHDTLSVTADATKVPDHLEASIDGLEAGTLVTAGDVKLPAGVELAVDSDLTVASITAAPTAEQLEATLPEVEVATDEAEAEVGETTEGSEGADTAAEGSETTEARTEA
ncbi:50S ribosomal protein L25/general stress protein Ctc [Micromonospora sp. C81]|uniref:50S ribosomal protein L25/general stress protein Ctc n=1 Tax=Micromonospora sp. C81 TaxID=2824881 RepID=UPI001B37139F|nr:50S ribosomal protein L25/general stress protein Ctc [Micromonospora sp. C81]MBQ1040159.1 50S ribosomal protein L25/general stress protein Ctc [Micromonospora sp. C81]